MWNFLTGFFVSIFEKLFSFIGKFFKKAVITVPVVAFLITLEFVILDKIFDLVQPLILTFPYLNYLVYFGFIQGIQNYILILITAYSSKKALDIAKRFI
ncbi:hypothetical protein ACH5BF_02115 [Arcobacter sp. YIC-464]|uniref:hypothetical protein n=1 Tax=Arcobacter sp. YIC-464 TaxID=3376631 RepID=UPI003C1C5755